MQSLRTFICVCVWMTSIAYGATPPEKVEKEEVFFTLTAPKGWSCIQDKNELPGKIQAVYIGSGNGTFTPSINLATEKTTMPIGDYTALAKKYHEGQGDTKCINLGTLKTKAGEMHLLQIDRHTQWGPVRFLQASVIHEGIAYVLTATCLSQEFSALHMQFFQAIQSFTILSGLENKRPLSSLNALEYNNGEKGRKDA